MALDGEFEAEQQQQRQQQQQQWLSLPRARFELAQPQRGGVFERGAHQRVGGRQEDLSVLAQKLAPRSPALRDAAHRGALRRYGPPKGGGLYFLS